MNPATDNAATPPRSRFACCRWRLYRVNEKIQTILDIDTEPWGIKVTKVELK